MRNNPEAWQEEVVDAMFQVFGNLQSEYDEWVKDTRDKVDVAIAEIERGERSVRLFLN